jgi:hypothetical protein
MDVSVLKVAASGATSGGNDPPPIRDRHAPIRQSPVKGNVRGRFIIPCRVSREPTFASVHGISFSPRFSPITFSSLFFMPRSAVWKSVVSSKGSYGAHAAARSGRGAVCRKIFLFPCGRAYFPTKSCSSYPRHLLMLPKQIQWYMDVSVLKVAASGATSGGNDPPPIRDRHAPIRQSPVKGNVRGRFIIPCRVSREPTFASVHGISFSPRFSPITFSSLFFMPRSAVWKSVVSSKGSYGAHAAARSGRGAVCRKIFLFPCGRAYFPTKSCSSYPRHLLMLPKQIPSIPAPLRHKKKVKGYEKRREK